MQRTEVGRKSTCQDSDVCCLQTGFRHFNRHKLALCNSVELCVAAKRQAAIETLVQCATEARKMSQLRCNTTALAPPPPLQMAAKPTRASLLASTLSSRTSSTAPLAPMGCPNATALPCALHLYAHTAHCRHHMGYQWRSRVTRKVDQWVFASQSTTLRTAPPQARWLHSLVHRTDETVFTHLAGSRLSRR